MKLKTTLLTFALSCSMSTLTFAGHHEEGEDKIIKEQKFSKCAAVRMKEVKLAHILEDEDKHSMAIPEGWTVVSGSGGKGHPKVLLCK